MKNRKGLSNIIATVLIVLLALAAIAIVWGFLRQSITGTGESLSVSQKCLDAVVEAVSCDATSRVVNVQLKQGSASQVVGAITWDDGSITSATGNAPTLLGTASVTPAASGSATAVSATAAAIVLDSDGNAHTCEASSVEVTCA